MKKHKNKNYWFFLGALGLGYSLTSTRRPVLSSKIPRYKPQPVSWPKDALSISWLGHASFLINIYGKRILIDPTFESRIGPTLPGNLNIGPKRLVRPALPINELGSIDILLMSHGHTDHFDYPSIRKLQSYFTAAVTAKNTSFLWNGLAFREVRELGWGEIAEIDGVIVKAIQGRHAANRYPWLAGMTANCYLISFDGINIFFGGDTGYTPIIREQLRGIPIDIAILGIGNYLPVSNQMNHCTPEQAWQLANEIGASWVVPMHWGTFRLSDEPVNEPLARFLWAAGPHSPRIPLWEIGQSWIN